MIEREDLDRRFRFHPATTDDRRIDHETIRGSCGSLARIVNNHVPDGREKALALTKIEEAMMWANAGIARQPAESPSSGERMLTVEQIARVCHEANRELQEINGEPVSDSWGFLEEETRESARDGVEAALRGLTPEQMHENWSAFKIEHGWQYGEVKSLEHKRHPCLLPYDELPPEQRVKDSLFSAIVKALA